MRLALEGVLFAIAGLLVGLMLRSVLPAGFGLDIVRGNVAHVFPLTRLAFWVSVMSGILVGLILIVKAMLQDLGVG